MFSDGCQELEHALQDSQPASPAWLLRVAVAREYLGGNPSVGWGLTASVPTGASTSDQSYDQSFSEIHA